MLRELFIWSSSKAVPAARQSGLVSEIAGIAGRYSRHKNNWDRHLSNTRDYIQANLQHAKPGKPILVLGSGLCLDLPLAELNNHDGGVILMDAVIPLASRLKCRKFENIAFRCQDLTGFLSPFWNSKEGDTITPPSSAPLPNGDFGLVISCNILSQLPLSFSGSPPENDTERHLYSAIQLAHMRALEKYECPIVIIADYERLETQDGQTETITTVPPQLLPGDPHKSWQWHIAPEGETGPGVDTKLNVGAWLLSSL